MLGITMNQKPRTIYDPLDPNKEISEQIRCLRNQTVCYHNIKSLTDHLNQFIPQNEKTELNRLYK